MLFYEYLLNFDVQEACRPFFMCLFSFEPGNCVLPRADGTWASKDFRFCLKHRTHKFSTSLLLDKIHAFTYSWTKSVLVLFEITAKSYIPKDYSRRKKAIRLKNSGTIVLSWTHHQNAIQSKRKGEKIKGLMREKGTERDHLSNVFFDFPEDQIQQAR